MKRAFTFVETMIATSIAVVVTLAACSAFVVVQRMMRESMAQTELSLAVRQLREKLLFHAAPPIDGVTYAGMLSGTNASSVVEGGSTPNIQMNCTGVGSSFSSQSAQSMRIMLWGSSSARFLLNERIPNKDAHADWLRPGKLTLADTSIADIVGYDTADGTAEGIYKVHLDIRMKSDVKDSNGDDIIRREHITVPVFGRVQPLQDSSGRY